MPSPLSSIVPTRNFETAYSIMSDPSIPPLMSLSLSSGAFNQSIDDSSEIPEFVDKVDPTYICPKCILIVRNALQTPCGHRVCQLCVNDIVASHGSSRFRCPAAEEDCVEMTGDEIRPDFYARRHVGSLRVYCYNRRYGCHEVMQWRKLKDHIELDQCKYNIESCPNNCGTTNIQRSLMSQHLAVCPRHKKPCKFHVYGCVIQDTEVNLRKHYEQGAQTHLEFVMVEVAKISLANTELHGLCEELKANLMQTSAKCVELSSSNDSCMRQIAVLTNKLTSHEQSTARSLAIQSEGIIKLDQKTNQMQSDLSTVSARWVQVERQIQTVQETGGRRGGPATVSLPEEVRVQLISHDRTIAIHDVRLAEMDLRLQCTETTNYDGILIWKVTEYRRRKLDAVNGGTLSLYSQPFYTSRYGYKLCARVYLNGDGAGKNSHVSFFLVVMQGDYDDLLTWPFKQRVTLCLLDQRTQRNHMADTFRPDPTSSSFQKPTSQMNVASGCPLFIAHKDLEVDHGPYLVNDQIYFKIAVDTSDLANP